MVSCRLVDREDGVSEKSNNLPNLPGRLFAAGEEPEGVRVTSYHTYNAINDILAVLDADEIQFLRKSPFGQFIATSEKPTFSGRFAKFLISRQLRVTKKHEVWFIFASNPIRFSLREFAIVTGLPCGKFPKPSKKRTRKNLVETPYWPSLFGKLDNVSVKAVLKMLRRRTVKDKDIRIKYACLALVASVLLPTSHHPKISKEHVEIIKDLDYFFKYPWGRVGFNLVMGSLKERNELSLSQRTVAVRGFVQAIQLVLVEAVPELTRVVDNHCSSGSEAESDSDPDDDDEPTTVVQKPSTKLSPGHARVVDGEAKCIVRSILPVNPNTEENEADFGWTDDEEDYKVNNLVGLIEDGHIFKNEMFVGGSRKVDVERMRREARRQAEEKKKGKQKTKAFSIGEKAERENSEVIVVLNEMREEFETLKVIVKKSVAAVAEIRKDFRSLKNGVLDTIGEKMTSLTEDVLLAIRNQPSYSAAFNSVQASTSTRPRQCPSVYGEGPPTHKPATAVINNLLAEVGGNGDINPYTKDVSKGVCEGDNKREQGKETADSIGMGRFRGDIPQTNVDLIVQSAIVPQHQPPLDSPSFSLVNLL